MTTNAPHEAQQSGSREAARGGGSDSEASAAGEASATGTPADTAGAAAPAPGAESVAALREALGRTVRLAAVVCLLAGLATAVVAGLLAGWPGVWGGVIGVAISFFFLATTAFVASRVVGGDPLVMAAVILGSWLIKVVVLMAVILALRDAAFVDTWALIAGIGVGVLITLWAEVRELTAVRVPYADTSGR